jgi:alanyl-tRNA synthetase
MRFYAAKLMTTKLYWHDSHLTQFGAQVVECLEQDKHSVLVLDQTAFYPEGGGQPSDTGRINDVEVAHVETAADGRILHHLKDGASFQVGEPVTGVVDWARRRELMQQHTGQHILSQAFFQLFGAETKGFRISDEVTQIDLTLEARPDEIASAIAHAEELSNQVIFDNRAIRVHEVTLDEAAKLPLRKESFISDCVRVIEIDQFDWSPCGGTHAKQTGEVGLLVVRGWERAKQMTRVEFVCGVRALQDYRLDHHIADSLARQFTVGRAEVLNSVSRLQDENKTLVRRVRHLAEVAAQVEAQELLSRVGESNGKRVVARVIADRDFEETKLLAHKLVAQAGVVALLVTVQGESAKLVFARSADLASDMNALLRAACEELGGRGGGRPDFAQGGGSRINLLEQVLEKARDKV